MAALEASWAGKPLIPVIADDAEPPPFLRPYKWCRFPQDRGLGAWSSVAEEIAKTVRGESGSQVDSASHEKARSELRARVQEINELVKPLAAAEQEKK
jgi:hypothetical protein